MKIIKLFLAALGSAALFTGCRSTAPEIEKVQLKQIKNGILFLTFDDRNFDGWVNALPIFAKYNAKATFLVSGNIDRKALRAMKKLHAAGHSLGLHTVGHANADTFFETYGADAYIAKQVMPQLAACRKAGLPVPNFAYPNNARTTETDKVLFKYFRRLRAGVKGMKGKNPATVVQLFRPVSSLQSDHLMNGAGIGEYYNTDPDEISEVLKRAAKDNCAVVFFSHNIAPDAKHVHMPTAILERCLKEAQQLGIKVIGFNDIP